MKTTRRIPALLLAVLMLVSLTLTGCQKKDPPVAADKVAVSLFEMILKNDASSAVELFGYADEAEARADMGLDESLYDELADEMVSQFRDMKLNVTTEDAQAFVDAFISMFKDVNMTAVVKESDEKAGTAIVTCTIDTFGANALTDAMTDAMTDVMANPDLLNDEDALTSALLNGISTGIAGLTPSGSTADFDVEFELQTLTINGKDRQAWMPKDAEEFGNLISTTALGV